MGEVFKGKRRLFVKGGSNITVAIYAFDRQGDIRQEIDVGEIASVEVAMGGSHAPYSYGVSEIETARLLFKARCHELIDRDYDCFNGKK